MYVIGRYRQSPLPGLEAAHNIIIMSRFAPWKNSDDKSHYNPQCVLSTMQSKSNTAS